MAYSIQEDIVDQLDESSLIQLTDDEGTGSVVESRVTKAITDADATIDFHCQARYSVPLAPVPDKIRQISVDIAIYNLFSRRGDTAPETRVDRYNQALKDLRDIRDGKTLLGSNTPAPMNTENSVQIESNRRVFTRNNMRGF